MKSILNDSFAQSSSASQSRILIVDDEAEMREILVQALTEEGFVCGEAANGKDGLKLAEGYDLVLVDVMMPVMNGFVMIEKLRERGSRIPAIYLTAKDTTKDLVHGLNIGGDDYLVKPFKLDELIARVRAALRRSRDLSQVLRWHDFTLDCLKRTAFRGEVEIFLSATEFSLLEFFMRRPEMVLSKSLILEEVWHDEGYRDENIVETYVSYLRRKCEAHGSPRIIQTVRGRGYVLTMAKLEP
jgi:two-component system OmpR family response regulator